MRKTENNRDRERQRQGRKRESNRQKVSETKRERERERERERKRESILSLQFRGNRSLSISGKKSISSKKIVCQRHFLWTNLVKGKTRPGFFAGPQDFNRGKKGQGIINVLRLVVAELI